MDLRLRGDDREYEGELFAAYHEPFEICVIESSDGFKAEMLCHSRAGGNPSKWIPACVEMTENTKEVYCI
jgi:hypothetical protein